MGAFRSRAEHALDSFDLARPARTEGRIAASCPSEAFAVRWLPLYDGSARFPRTAIGLFGAFRSGEART